MFMVHDILNEAGVCVLTINTSFQAVNEGLSFRANTSFQAVNEGLNIRVNTSFQVVNEGLSLRICL